MYTRRQMLMMMGATGVLGARAGAKVVPSNPASTATVQGARTGPKNPIVTRLLFVAPIKETDQRGAIYFVRTDPGGGGRNNVTTDFFDNSWPTWSPNGRALAYAQWSGGRMNVVVKKFEFESSTSEPVAVATGLEPNRLDAQMSWGRNGLIAFHNEQQIWVARAGASPAARRNALRSLGRRDVRHPCWTYDGRLVFVDFSSGTAMLSIASPDFTRITPLGIAGDEPNVGQTYNNVVYVRGNTIFRRHLQGGPEQAVIADGRTPVFGPEDREIAFMRAGRIFVCDLNGGNVRPVTDGPNDRQPSWRRVDFEGPIIR